jgi:23S rRNA pseudouridine955/2504/2580 synthase
MKEVRTLYVDNGEDGVRLDRWFKRRWPHLNHIQLNKLFRSGQVRVDGSRVKADTKLTAGSQVRVPPLPDAPDPDAKAQAVGPRDIAYAKSLVLYEDEEVLALNKPAGLAVQGGTKTTHHIDKLLSAWGEGVKRPAPGPPPRPRHLGRAAARQDAGCGRALSGAFAKRKAEKTYWALVPAIRTPQTGVIELHLAKKRHQRPRAGRAGRPQGPGRPAGRDRIRHHQPRRPARTRGWRCAPTPAARTSCAPT